MQKVFLTLIFLLSIMGSVASAAEISTDKMILAWQTSKVWVSDGELCVSGNFINRRNDLVITKLNDFVINIKFIDNAGKKRVFSGKPVKIPFCRIIANGSRKVSFNFGKFDYSLNNWLTSQEYEFTYVPGAKF